MTQKITPQLPRLVRASESIVQKVWTTMASLFGHSWVSAFGDNPAGKAGDVWAASLFGLNAEQIAKGIQETITRASEYPPSAPAFRSMCLGIPQLAEVRTDMKRDPHLRSPFTVLVLQNLDQWRHNAGDVRTSERLLAEAYELATAHVSRGNPLPAPPKCLADQERRALEERRANAKYTPDFVKQHCAEIAEKLGFAREEQNQAEAEAEQDQPDQAE